MFLRNGRAGRLVIDAGNCRAKPTLDQSRVPRADAAEPIGKLQRRLSGRLARQWHRFGANGPEQAAAAIPVAALASKRRTDVGSAYGSARVSGILDSPGRRDGTLRHGRTIDTDPAQALSPGVCDSGCSGEERGKTNSMLSDHVMWVRMGASMPIWGDVRIQMSSTKHR
jgi:hypothetical protein